MTFLTIYLTGLIIGLSIAAPVGPIAILCIKTSIKHGRLAGVAIGMGAALADTSYAALGIFSLSLIKTLIATYAVPLRLAGGLLLILIGLRAVFSKTELHKEPKVSGTRIVKSLTTGFFLTLTNPATTFAFVAAATAFGFHFDETAHAHWLVFGVFCGALLWWFILSFNAPRVKQFLNEDNMHRIHLAAGGAIAACGVIAVISGLWLL